MSASPCFAPSSIAARIVGGTSSGRHTPTLGDEAGLRQEMEVNDLGPIAVTHAFAPVLGANGGGALINVLSGLSWFTLPDSGGYSSAKAALWMEAGEDE